MLGEWSKADIADSGGGVIKSMTLNDASWRGEGVVKKVKKKYADVISVGSLGADNAMDNKLVNIIYYINLLRL